MFYRYKDYSLSELKSIILIGVRRLIVIPVCTLIVDYCAVGHANGLTDKYIQQRYGGIIIQRRKLY